MQANLVPAGVSGEFWKKRQSMDDSIQKLFWFHQKKSELERDNSHVRILRYYEKKFWTCEPSETSSCIPEVKGDEHSSFTQRRGITRTKRYNTRAVMKNMDNEPLLKIVSIFLEKFDTFLLCFLWDPWEKEENTEFL